MEQYELGLTLAVAHAPSFAARPTAGAWQAASPAVLQVAIGT